MTTRERILVAMREHRFSGLGAGDIARAAGLAESTVRTWLPRLRTDRLVFECGRFGWWALSGDGYQRADELIAANYQRGA
jgi:DNA-binding IclR family transcriptional regulator